MIRSILFDIIKISLNCKRNIWLLLNTKSYRINSSLIILKDTDWIFIMPEIVQRANLYFKPIYLLASISKLYNLFEINVNITVGIFFFWDEYAKHWLWLKPVWANWIRNRLIQSWFFKCVFKCFFMFRFPFISPTIKLCILKVVNLKQSSIRAFEWR